MQKKFELEQGIPEIWGFKKSEMILLRETKKRNKYHVPLLETWETRMPFVQRCHEPLQEINYFLSKEAVTTINGKKERRGNRTTRISWDSYECSWKSIKRATKITLHLYFACLEVVCCCCTYYIDPMMLWSGPKGYFVIFSAPSSPTMRMSCSRYPPAPGCPMGMVNIGYAIKIV